MTTHPSATLSKILPILLLVLCGFSALRARAQTPPATWTTGHKKVLIIPVRFTDVAGPSDVPSTDGVLSGWGDIANGTMTTEISEFMAYQSYGQCTVEFTVLPEIDMGVGYVDYYAPLNPDSALSKFTRWYEPGSFADDARARARQAGLGTATPALYDTDNYDLDIIATGFIPRQDMPATSSYLASGLTYGKGIVANLFTALPHEICHNLGLSHAWGWSRSTFHAPLPRNTFLENKYANVFDLMGNKETHDLPMPPDRDAGVFWKNALGWLPDEYIATASSSGTYRIHAFDQGSLDAGKLYGLKIVRDPAHAYWCEYRQAITGTDALWTQNGLIVEFGAQPFQATSGNTFIIDMTPGTRGSKGATFSTMHDAPLALGRTYTDSEADLHITPIKKGGTIPESLDVVVNHGPFLGNGAPSLTLAPVSVAATAGVPKTFTATASDPNGDPLAYHWEFDDPDQPAGVKTGGSDPDTRLATQGTHTWTRNGTYLVRCTVSDMKGGKKIVSSQVTVTGGTSGILTISGVIRDENNNPIQGAIVNNFSQQVAPLMSYDDPGFAASGETAADGKYTIQLPYPGPGQVIYKLSVLYQGYTFTCNIGGGSISVTSSSRPNINFTRVRTNRTISGSVAVAGRSYDPAIDGPITVSTGVGSDVAVSNGFWSTTVPDGTLVNVTATPSNPAYIVGSYFISPQTIVADTSTFFFPVTIPGQMPETGFASSGASSDDSVGTVNIPMMMTLPPGYNSWISQQDFFYWIDPSSTAEYGVDYKMSGGFFTYYGGVAPSPRYIPLKIIPTGTPKNKTVVIKMGVGNSNTASLGPISTFTYTITNPFRITSTTRIGNTIQLVWDSVAGVNYTIESTPSLNPATWASVAPHIDLPGVAGTMTRSFGTGNAPSQFYRIKAAW